MISVAHFGSRPLSRHCLEIMEQHPRVNVKTVVTYPPNHEGWWDGSLSELAEEYNIPVVEEPDVFNYDIDYIISTLYYNIIDKELLDHPTHGGLNLHQAELPKYRGSNTFSHAILNAREDDYWKYGTTLHFMSENVDQGDIIARRFVEITETDTAKSLYKRVEKESVCLFIDMLPDIISGKIQEMRSLQEKFDGERYFYTKESLDGEKHIDYKTFKESENQVEIYDKIRALDFPPFEPAFTKVDGKKVYLRTRYDNK